jgi:hypothetical protein
MRTTKQMPPAKAGPQAPTFDPEVIRELARCYARAAVDAMIDEQKATQTSEVAKPKRGARAAT